MEFVVYPLFSKLPAEEQERVFSKKRDNCRMIVATTNVAETSITIPNIRYVVDSGKEK
jgi:ATP-dependent RNA helicase DHX37/DHR1